MRAFFAVCLSIPVLAAPAFGWGCEGHQIVALIARAHLTPAASGEVDKLLNGNPVDPSLKRFCKDRPGDPMADASTWADDVKSTEKTGAWHYIDIPLNVTETANLSAWCSPIGPSVGGKDRSGCVTDAIEHEWSVLRDKSIPDSERATALRYVIHLMGDMHQPLHDSDNNDRGGNCTAMTFWGEERPANLHAIWDYKLIQRDLTKEKTDQKEYASAIDRTFARQWKTWDAAEIDVEGWAREGQRLARKVAYGDLTPPIPFEPPGATEDCDGEKSKVAAIHISIDQKYFEQTMPVIDEQLAKAGHRLAALLNRTF